jgi:carboxypeptidase Q
VNGRYDSMKRTLIPLLAWSCLAATSGDAQAPGVPDPVLTRILEIGTRESRAEEIAQVLLDSIGPRLTGSPALERANDWSVELIRGWGVDARKERYGTWLGWDRGVTRVELVEPRVRSLEATMLAWSGGTDGPVEAPVVIVPEFADAAELQPWLATVADKFVAIGLPQPTCRPDAHFEEWGGEGALEALRAEREAALDAFSRGVPSQAQMRVLLQQAGAAGVLQSGWAGQIGVTRVHSTNVVGIPTIDIGCEDYGLLWRLADNEQGPILRVDARATFLGEVPVYNTIAEIRGVELPDEYVVLSAHFDSWDGASGATDNGTGITVMLEALRILREVHPRPRRTLLLGLWGGEEQGINGSRRFAATHPYVVDNLQALFNQDRGTGRTIAISAQGLVGAGEHLVEWLSRMPEEVAGAIEPIVPGQPSAGTSDHAAFICAGAPAFDLIANEWSYGAHTWHTNRDTYDKIVFEEVRANAVLVAMLAYLASEDPRRVSRERAILPPGPDGEPATWPACAPGMEASP